MQTIIFLNGTSSSGKSSISKEILGASSKLLLHLKLDGFIRMALTDRINNLEILNVLVRGFHRSLGALASAGNSMVIDHVLQERHWLPECLESLKDYRVYFVGVKCDLEILELRERDRKDRKTGMAAYQYPIVHAGMIYDLEVDTTKLKPAECAKMILDYVDANPDPSAWKKMIALMA